MTTEYDDALAWIEEKIINANNHVPVYETILKSLKIAAALEKEPRADKPAPPNNTNTRRMALIMTQMENTNPFPPGQFGVIYADPPWKYEMYSEKGTEKCPPYKCMSYDEMAAMRDDVLFASAPNSVLFMWTTWAADPRTGTNHLQQALDLMAAWGFARVSGGSWHKTTRTGNPAMGMGYYFRSASEPFIIGVSGKPKVKNHGTRNALFTGDVPENLNDLGICISSLAREHSRKPDEMATLLQNLFDGPYLELFAETTRPGWSSWGKPTGRF